MIASSGVIGIACGAWPLTSWVRKEVEDGSAQSGLRG